MCIFCFVFLLNLSEWGWGHEVVWGFGWGRGRGRGRGAQRGRPNSALTRFSPGARPGPSTGIQHHRRSRNPWVRIYGRGRLCRTADPRARSSLWSRATCCIDLQIIHDSMSHLHLLLLSQPSIKNNSQANFNLPDSWLFRSRRFDCLKIIK